MQGLHTLRLAGNGCVRRQRRNGAMSVAPRAALPSHARRSLTALPPSVWKLPNLRVLDLRGTSCALAVPCCR
jgi:hypothetical protein